VLAVGATVGSALRTAQDRSAQSSSADGDARDPVVRDARRMIRDGRQTFRFDTFGDEAFWGGALQLHLAIEGEKFGGVGPGVSPRTALAVGLKVDSDALPPDVIDAIRNGTINLDDPATTLALLRLNAVVGVTGHFNNNNNNNNGSLQSMGIQCA